MQGFAERELRESAVTSGCATMPFPVDDRHHLPEQCTPRARHRRQGELLKLSPLLHKVCHCVVCKTNPALTMLKINYGLWMRYNEMLCCW